MTANLGLTATRMAKEYHKITTKLFSGFVKQLTKEMQTAMTQ